MIRRLQVAIDCVQPSRLAAFWAEVLGYRLAEPPAGHASWDEFSEAEASQPDEQWRMLVDPDGTGPTVLLHRVPEPKVAKNRIHLDIWVDTEDQDREGAVLAEASRLVRLGGSVLRETRNDGEFYVVMADPEANEFCIA